MVKTYACFALVLGRLQLVLFAFALFLLLCMCECGGQ